jgi:hypothetical protein
MPSTPGTEGTDASSDDLDARALLRRRVESFDYARVGERVDLDPDAPVLAVLRNGADVLDQPLAQAERRNEDLAEVARPPEAGEVVEEVRDVGGDFLVGGEEAEVLVAAGGARVVVAGADVDVPLQVGALAAHDERRLPVDLQVGKAVDHVNSRALERARPLDVAMLVEPRLQLDEAHGLLAFLGRLDQRRHERRVVARAVHRRLEPDDARVVGGSLHERLKARRERRVRMVDEYVATPHFVEDRSVLRDEPRMCDPDPRLVLQIGPR